MSVDPDNLLTQEMQSKFRAVLSRYDDVFESDFKGYNGAVGPFEVHVNIGPTQPPQRKRSIPQYSCNMLVELQQKFDELETI